MEGKLMANKMVNGVLVEMTDEELAEVRSQTPTEPTWKENRQMEYPNFGDQFDMIYHDQVNGTTTFKDAIKAVKDKYPKS
tara:strand:- start:386 stop:625 length:240 start_codon:yes stop_codon:yes gene_type:complete